MPLYQYSRTLPKKRSPLQCKGIPGQYVSFWAI
jgi:hypothetical protein